MTTRPHRVFLAGDEVPAEIWVMAPNHFLIRPNARPFRAATPLVEMLEVPPFGALVEAEKARRAVEEEPE